MKAKHFRKLRAKCQYYDVCTTWGLFGRFDTDFSRKTTVLARSHVEAISRAKRRGVGRDLSKRENPTSEGWGRWKIKLSNKSDHWKNVVYY